MSDKKIQHILAKYPKERPELTERQVKIHASEYSLNRKGKGFLFSIIRRLESWMHHMVGSIPCTNDILEIGAGSLNHIPYEKKYGAYDCVEPFTELYSDSCYINCPRKIYKDIDQIPRENRYNKIISIAVLEHLEALPEIIAHSGLLLEKNGVFQAGIPTEGGVLWGLSWRITTAITYRVRTGLNYKNIMRHEHINDACEITEIIKLFFDKVTVKRFPTGLYDLSFYTYIEAREPKVELCKKYLAERNNEN